MAQGRARWAWIAVALSGLAFSGETLARDVPFGVGQSVSTSIRAAKAVATGDIDGDGDLDFVGAGDQFIQFGLVWFENNGGSPPGFTLRNISNSRILALNVQDAAVVDVDADGDLDIVTASQDSFGGIEIYRNGGLVPVTWLLQQVRTGGGYSALRVVDLDGDLDPDFVTCRRTTGEVLWLRHSGTTPPSFTAFTISTTVPGCESVAVADVDGNGTLDVVTAGFDLDEIAWHSNDGSTPPNWTKNVIVVDPDGAGGVEGFADGPRSVDVADLDGDLDLDIAVASENDDQIAWLENDGGASSFTPHTLVEDPDGAGPGQGVVDGPKKVVAIDMDGNDSIDLAFVSFNDDHFGWFDNSGLMPPSFTLRTLTRDPDGPITWGWAPAPGVTCPVAPSQFVAFPTGGEGSGAMDGPRDIAVGDLDGDGDPDLITASSIDARISWHENRSCGAIFPFQPPVAAGTTDGAASTAAADLDGDGDVDVVTAASIGGTVTWHENDGGLFPAFTQRPVGTGLAGAQSVHVADVDGDGHPDVLVAAANAGLIAWYENSGTTPPTFAQRIVASQTPSPRGIFGADVDGDGDTDILTATSADNAITLWDNLGGSPPMFEPRSLTRAGQAPWSVKAADVNGDGDLDVVYAALGSGRIGLLLNEGDSFTEVEVAPGVDPGSTDALGVARAAIDIAVGDFDGDGRADIASVSAHDDKVAWYINQGGTPLFFQEVVISEDPDGPIRIVVNTVTPTGPTPQCPGGTAVPATVTIQNPLSGPVNGASSVATADLDRDGDLDLAVTGVLDGTVAWYENIPVLSGREFLYRRVSDLALGARSVTAADLNRDGRPDLLSGAFRDDTVDWYLGADDDACILFDSNGDGEIEAAELILMGRSFGLAQSPQDDAAAELWWREADLNLDGRVDGDDLSALSASGVWGASVFTCHLTCSAGGAAD